MIPLAFPEPGAPQTSRSAPVAPATAKLRLLAVGLSTAENNLLEGVVTLSRRRPPRIELLNRSAADGADVIMINASDADAMGWAATRTDLAGKAVIWIDAHHAPPQHIRLQRPVQWPRLPFVLYQTLERSSVEAAVPAVRPGDANRRILIVDDSLPTRTQLRTLLERAGYLVDEAGSAETGLALHARKTYACILLDVAMPGMDGYQACHRIKTHGARQVPPVVMLSGKTAPFDRVRGKMAGCDAYLGKPVAPDRLLAVLDRHVGVRSRLGLQALSPAGAMTPALNACLASAPT